MIQRYFLDLFSGIGGFALGAHWAGLRFDRHYFSEVDDYALRTYSSRFPDAEPLGDIRAIQGDDLPRGDWIIAGGFPCQDISVAGKGAGLEGERSGLWYEYARIIGEIRPRYAIMENVGALAFRGLDSVLGSLAALGYDAEWQDIRASDVGAPHRRERIWIVAWDSNKIDIEKVRAVCKEQRPNTFGVCEKMAYANDGRPDARGKGLGTPDSNEAPDNTTRQGQDVPNADRGRCEGERERGLLDGERAALGDDVDGCNSAEGALADAERERLQAGWDCGGHGIPETEPEDVRSEIASGRDGALGNWWSVEPDVGGTLDGFSSWLDRLDGINTHKYNMTYGATEKERPGEILRALRSEVGAIQNKQQARRSECISPQEVLFAYLCELEARLDKQTDLFVESAETPQGSLRSLRDEEESPSASCGSIPEKQSTGKYSDSLQALPRLLARDAEKAWISYRRENASTIRHWESGIARVANGIPARVDRLKCLGNSIVPQIAELIFAQPAFDEWRL